jgi:hypothetical protein
MMDKPKYPIVLTKFKPADVDPDIKLYGKSVIQTALYLLGINKKILASTAGSKKGEGLFWKKSPKHLWSLLELAKRRYELEIAHAHPDRGGNVKRAAQLNAAWSLVKKLFAKHGYILH